MYRLKLHKTLTPEKWSKYPTDQQILMIANEVNRLSNGIKMSLSKEDLQSCIERVFELTDMTIECHKGSLRKELLRWREIFSKLYLLSKTQLKRTKNQIRKLYKVLLLLNPKSAILAF